MISRPIAIVAAILIIFTFGLYHNSGLIPKSTSSTIPAKAATSPTKPSSKSDSNAELGVPHAETYFEQVFSERKPPQYDFPALKQQCERTKWPEDEVYLQCGGMAAGLTSIMSQVKVCLKMAVEAGTGIVLPSMPLRDSKQLDNFNFLNGEAYLTYDQWFDAEHLISQMNRACPQMKIVHPNQLDALTEDGVQVKNKWSIDLAQAPGYVQFMSYFWAGRPFKSFFEEQLGRLENLQQLDPHHDDTKKGITIINISSQFLVFRITDDPTGEDLHLWNDLGHLIRFNEVPRKIVNQLIRQINRPFYGVHFRVEKDTIWSSLENQLAVDLDALDTAWTKYGDKNSPKPLVYLACGDQEQVEKFVAEGKNRGWDVTHKWNLASTSPETLSLINGLAFDFQGAVDMGLMVKSEFFLGITGSAFSSSIGNVRDRTGRYRGSSFLVWDDEGARTHLFNDGDAGSYACCL
ncbi:uncharacterized protein LY89DRAFT_692397 [Mollisia scopiformis]|uniref:O-fucosyltransferase family protein n=1 Tax=Mollisia scopiformis TaxID=149040 RepID=A0A132B2F8_MOLSC|nr:uncharacterized protein LY89DRAFT_692397 [Mollisia scopiformis]KUJ06585.1 hypothetical protein LY89DRAFT_692397 [Mollisia scopiformis]